MFTARVRLTIYIVAIVIGLICAGLALFGIVTPDMAKDAVIVLGIIFGGVSGLAAKNVTPD